MRLLKGIERFDRYTSEIKNVVGGFIINDGKYQEMLDKMNNYEKLLGIKDNKFNNNDMSETNVKNMLLYYLDYLDYYIMSHFLANVYDISYNPLSFMQVDQNIDLAVDFVMLLYQQKYPGDKEVDMVKYDIVRKEFEAMFGRI